MLPTPTSSRRSRRHHHSSLTLVLLLSTAIVAACTGGGGSSRDVVEQADSGRWPEGYDPSQCNPGTGMPQPLTVCSAEDPCLNPLPLEEEGTIATPSNRPTCRVDISERPFYDDGPPLEWTDSTGVDRYACMYTPEGTSAESPRPLVLWFHGSGGGADDLYNRTSLRTKAIDYDLSGDLARPGFILLSVEGRNLHWPSADPRDGAQHDTLFRDFYVPSINPDIANADRLIDDIASTGIVDTSRIYVVGWSSGGLFAQMVSIARHDTPTGIGYRIAAGASYSAADPFHEAALEESPSCRLDPYPTSTVPLILVSRACDVVACNDAQFVHFQGQGLPVIPGGVMENWVGDLRSVVGDPNTSWILVGADGRTADSCTPTLWCSWDDGYLNHIRWQRHRPRHIPESVCRRNVLFGKERSLGLGARAQTRCDQSKHEIGAKFGGIVPLVASRRCNVWHKPNVGEVLAVDVPEYLYAGVPSTETLARPDSLTFGGHGPIRFVGDVEKHHRIVVARIPISLVNTLHVWRK